jgi:hypothetical protein
MPGRADCDSGSAAELGDQQPDEGQEEHDQIDVEKGHGRPFF